MKKILILIVLLGAEFAMARQIYWTGEGYSNDSYQCRSEAIADGNARARQSCVQDYKINRRTCYSAPVVNIQQVGYCSYRVYIQVP